MKKFAFRLQVVLDRAQQDEDDALRALARLQEQLAEAAERVHACQRQREALLGSMADLQAGCFDPRYVAGSRLRMEALAADLRRLRGEEAAIDARVTVQRQAVMQAVRRRQMLAKLRTQAQTEHQRDVERSELRTMEEAVLPRLAREQMEARHAADL